MKALPVFSFPLQGDASRVSNWHPAPLASLLAIALGASAVAGVASITATGMRIEVGGFARFAILAAAMGGIAQWCRWRGIDQRLVAAAGIVGAGTMSLMLCGILASVGLRMGFPEADGALAAADAALGLDAGKVIRAIVAYPALTAFLSIAYKSSGPLVAALVFVTLARGSTKHAWELAATAFVAMQIVALASPFFPAWGVMRHFGLESLQGIGLPQGAGVYQWPAFAHFYSGTDPVLRLADMGGVVAFPSFHTVLALIVTQALVNTRLRWAGIVWSAVIVLSAVPMGGHYVVDLAAGVVVWLVAASLVRRLSNPSA